MEVGSRIVGVQIDNVCPLADAGLRINAAGVGGRTVDQLAAVLDELRRIEAAGELRDELLDNIELITRTLYGMKEGSE